MVPETQTQTAVVDEKSSGFSRPVETLLRLISDAPLHRGADDRLYVRVPVGSRSDFFELRSPQLRDWLVNAYFKDHGVPPSPSAIGRVIAVLEARARFQDATRPVFVRVAVEDADTSPAYFLDMGDPSGRAIEIRDSGWTIAQSPGIEFRRPAGMLPFPLPRTDGSIDLLKPYVNLDERDFRLFIAWLTAAMRPVGPYPPLVLQGVQDSAKTTLARIARLLIDPHAVPLLGELSSTRDLMTTAVNVWLLALDNVSPLAAWLSDSLCRLAFGAGHASRSLFSNDQLTYLHAQRPIILTGVNDFVTRGDLIDRSLIFYLKQIRLDLRRTEVEYWSSFRNDYPAILGGLLDAVVGGLRQLPSVVLTNVPRMADFAHWGEAVGRALGWPNEELLNSYRRNRGAATIGAIEESMVATVLMTNFDSWSGSFPELHALLTEGVGKKLARSSGWPKTTASFARELRRIAPQLRTHGMSITFSQGTKSRRLIIRRGRAE
jgi:hypothetical protein